MMDTMKKDDTPGLFAAFADRPLADRLRPAALEEIGFQVNGLSK